MLLAAGTSGQPEVSAAGVDCAVADAPPRAAAAAAANVDTAAGAPFEGLALAPVAVVIVGAVVGSL